MLLPTAPENVMLPVPAARVRLFPPSMVFKKLIAAFAAAVEIGTVEAKVIGPANDMVLAAVILLLRVTVPLPVWLNPPLKERVAPDPNKAAPLLLMASGPPLVVLTILLNVNAVPARLIPTTFVVARGPLKVVVPVPVA